MSKRKARRLDGKKNRKTKFLFYIARKRDEKKTKRIERKQLST